MSLSSPPPFKLPKLQKGIRKIAVHGESIGGILATHLASHCQVDLLVADRTFANLEAVAARLIAQWAATALRISTRWDTNNVRNYLNATCPKILCCDPDDEIIAGSPS
jgi:esterase/lipase